MEVLFGSLQLNTCSTPLKLVKYFEARLAINIKTHLARYPDQEPKLVHVMLRTLHANHRYDSGISKNLPQCTVQN
jgi:hypothetical protein